MRSSYGLFSTFVRASDTLTDDEKLSHRAASRQFDDAFLATSEQGERCGNERSRSWQALASEGNSDRESGCGRG